MTAHGTPLESDGACVILFTENKVLLQKRDSRPPRDADKWAIFGGRFEPGETPVAAVCRELQDELGYELTPAELEPLGRFRVPRETRWCLVHYFKAPLNRDLWQILVGLGRARSLEREGDGIALFSHDEVDYLRLRCEDRVALERHFQGRAFGFEN